MTAALLAATALVRPIGSVVAHQGGWDEALLVLGPMVVFAGLLAIARRRVDEEAQEDEGGGEPPPDAHDGGGPGR